jgi:hypothetical protein
LVPRIAWDEVPTWIDCAEAFEAIAKQRAKKERKNCLTKIDPAQ